MIQHLLSILQTYHRNLTALSQSSEVTEQLLSDLCTAVCSLYFELTMAIMASNVTLIQRNNVLTTALGELVSPKGYCSVLQRSLTGPDST